MDKELASMLIILILHVCLQQLPINLELCLHEKYGSYLELLMLVLTQNREQDLLFRIKENIFP